MKNLGQAFVVLAFFFGLNVVAALAVVGLGKLVPEMLREEPMIWLAVALAGIAVAIWLALKGAAFSGRSPWRSPARGRG